MMFNIAMLTEQMDGVGFGKFIIFLFTIYFVIKSAVKNGIEEAYEEIKAAPTGDNSDDYDD